MNLPRFDAPVAFVDVETTGGHAGWHRVTDVAIVAMCAGEIEWEWHSLVNPGTSIPPSIQVLTGITNEMVAAAPRFEDLAAEILRRLDGRLFVAHNVRFDYGFIRSELRRAGHAFSTPQACTVRLSRHLYPDGGRHNLDAVMARHGIACRVRHRALPDAQVIARFWQVLRDAWPAERLQAALETVSRRSVLPPQIAAGVVDDLPESSGVYRFFGADDALIYIGKANNLRERVLEHFAGAMRDSKSQRLSAQTQRIEWTETAGELGALLLESRLVRELKPVYNRRLRGGESWTWAVSDDGSAPRLVGLDGYESGDGGDVFGIFRSEKLARSALTKLAREARLCLRVLGLEPAGAGSCFGHQVGRCAGVCVGLEPLLRHGARLKLALAPLRLKSWPYRGPVGIREISPMGLTQVHVVDQWQYLGSMTGDELERPSKVGQGFDSDAYRILTRYLKPGMRGVQLLDPPARGGGARARDVADA